ncbi:TIGR03086 family metal-binding protein [Actinomadura hibisca]|uniref:TIGR03086 family metal-binding protein n=1 Tax=Actinomadura hibisca TaxID=68565 RepID=UPI00082ED298|nr:TIGR03086 family metal-binding protein [Actinomadura hibisca]
MSPSDDPIALLTRALDQTGAVIARVRREQAGEPTPCLSWDVRTLVGHVVDEVARFAAVTGGGEERHPPSTGPDGEDWIDAYIDAAESLLKSWQRPGAFDGTVRLASGEVPAAWTFGRQVTELVLHAWDIAKATGQPTDLDPELGRYALAWGRENLTPEHRADETTGEHIGPEVPAPEDASLYEQIAAFGGRDAR